MTALNWIILFLLCLFDKNVPRFHHLCPPRCEEGSPNGSVESAFRKYYTLNFYMPITCA